MPLTRRDALGPTFRRLFIASATSNVGDGVLVATLPLVAHGLTSDPVAISAVTVAATLPWLLFSLMSGVIVDRADRRRLMITANAGRALVVGLLAAAAVTGTLTVAALLASVFLLGAAETIFDTASQAWLPAIVPGDQLETANGRLFGAQVAANQFIGPPLGAALFTVTPAVPFLANVAAFTAGTAVLRTVPATHRGRRRTRGRSVLADVREGLAWVWRDRAIRAFAVGAAAVNLAYTASMAVAVLLLRDELGVSAFGFGLTLTGAAAGSIAGARAAAPIVAAVGRRRAAVTAVLFFGGALALAAAAPNGAVVAVALALFGAAGEVWNVVAVSYRQARVPERLLGRVMATYRFVAYGAIPVGAAVGGAAAKVLGVRSVFGLGALAMVLVVVYVTRETRDALLDATGR